MRAHYDASARGDLPAMLADVAADVGIGTYTGTFRATGKAMAARVAHVWQVRDARVVAFEQFTDTLLVEQAIRTDA